METEWQKGIIETPRLMLRAWREEDAEALFRFASDPLVGPAAGWPPHVDVSESLRHIHGVLAQRETYAVVLRVDISDAVTGEIIPAETPVGSVGIMFPRACSCPHVTMGEVEIGYWIGVPLWGHGLIPEAVRAVLARCFTELGCLGAWCGYYDGNEKSRRVQEKCGFLPRGQMDIPRHPLNGATVEHFTYISREDWAALQAPVTHEMKLRERPYRAVESGKKTVEMRLYDEKRRMIRAGDFIRFSLAGGDESVTAKVIALHVCKNFEELYDALLPSHGAVSLGYAEGEVAHPADMLNYYPAEEILRHGVVGMEIERIPEEI